MRGWRAYLIAPLIGAAAALTLLSLDSENGLGCLITLLHRTHQLEARLGELRGERLGLVQTVRQLKDDPLTVEGVARRKLGMVRPGDLVVRLPDPLDEPPGFRAD
jgi:cell division protein FtsB